MDKKTTSRKSKARKINKIIIHCSDSDYGNAALITKWHIQNNKWNTIGYHYVILNGKIVSRNKYRKGLDGELETGRDESVVGAHCKGYNSKSIGICLIGKSGDFTNKQYTSLGGLISTLQRKYPDAKVMFHSDLNKKKPNCPGITAKGMIEVLSEIYTYF